MDITMLLIQPTLIHFTAVPKSRDIKYPLLHFSWEPNPHFAYAPV